MSEFKVNTITNRDGSHGPQVCGITTFGSSGMQLPSGSTGMRGGTRGRAIYGGGNSYQSRMEFHSIASGGGGTDFGDLSVALNRPHACSSSTRGIIAGGTDPSPAEISTIQYVTISSSGGVADFGDLTYDRANGDAASNDTRGVISAGYDAPTNYRGIDFVTIASTGNSQDFGDGLENRGQQTISSATRYVSAGGYGSPKYDGSGPYVYLNNIDYHEIATKGNAVPFGELSISAYAASGGTSSSTRGIFANWSVSPGVRVNTIEYITIATTGNTTDFGDMTTPKAGSATSNSTRGICMGGATNPSGAATNVIDFISIATTGDAKDFGDLLFAGRYAFAISDSHGGIE